MLAFIVAAALWHRRRTGGVARVDFSMIEAMLWTMAEPLLATQLGAPPQPQRQPFRPLRPARRLSLRRRRRLAQHRRYATTKNGDRLCAHRPDLVRRWPAWGLASAPNSEPRSMMRSPAGCVRKPPKPRRPNCCAPASRQRRSPPRSISSTAIICASAGFGMRMAPAFSPACRGMPASAAISGAAPELGADTDAVLHEVLDLSPDEIAALRNSGAFG